MHCYQWRRQDLVSGGHDERGTEGASIEGPKGAEWGRYGEGVHSTADYGVWGSVVSSPSGVRGGAPAAIAFSAYY